MVRLDMSEYMEKHTTSRLIGAPPGYVGYEEGGQLTEAIRRSPYSIILLDEIEKAHPDVFNILLQILDDGRLTDGHGKTVDFRNTVLIMTSNIGSSHFQDGGSFEKTSALVREEIKNHFKPEFINRIDEIIIFHPLNKSHIKGIIDIQIKNLLKRLDEKRILLRVTDGAKDVLIEKGFDPTYGARPLKRTIQKLLLDPLSGKLLSGEFSEGSTIEIDFEEKKGLVFRKVN